jgi:membrane fusion protein (multidrug efflux system)
MKINIFLLFLLFFYSCNKNEIKTQKKEDILKKIKERSVRTTITNQKKFNNKIIVNGKINSINKTELRFNASEKLTQINVFNGNKVKRGEIIASLQKVLLKNNIEKAKIELQKAQNKFEEEKINFGANIKKSSFENLKIRSGLLEAQNNLERTQIEYNQTLLKAPFSGVIANLEKKEGDFITTSDIFCTLINPNNLEVYFSILENEYQFVSKGQEVEIESFVNKDQFLKGTVTEINPLVDENGLIKIKAKVLSKETNLLDGMNVRVLINKALKDVIVIPKGALVLRSNRQVVFTLEKGLAKWNYVEVVGENNNSYAIKKGLKVTDTIIVSDNLNLSHDSKVNATFIEKEVNIE